MVVAAARAVDHPVADFLQDPADAFEGPTYIGAVSTGGAVLWAAAAAACLVAALVLPSVARAPFLFGAALTAVLLADDLYQLHEMANSALGIPQAVPSAAYAVAIVVYVVVFRDFVRRHGPALLPIALGLFGLSSLIDLALEEDAPMLLEDGAKLFGIVTWTVFFTSAAVTDLRDATRGVA
jgi:hypothetical protein